MSIELSEVNETRTSNTAHKLKCSTYEAKQRASELSHVRVQSRFQIRTYIYIACCQVAVKFYRDLYFLYRPANVPASRASGDWTDIDFLILLWKYNSRD